MATIKITINENGKICVPEYVQMRPFEIAEMFGICVQTINAGIKAVLKSGIVKLDTSCPATVYGNTILPNTYGLEMITAIAFRVNSPKAGIFRKWIIHKLTENSKPQMEVLYIQLSQRASLN